MLALAEVGCLGSKPLVFTFNAWAQSRCGRWVTPWHQRHPVKPSESFPLLGWNFLWDEMWAPLRLPQNPAPPLALGCWGWRIGATRRVIFVPLAVVCRDAMLRSRQRFFGFFFPGSWRGIQSRKRACVGNKIFYAFREEVGALFGRKHWREVLLIGVCIELVKSC